MLRNVSLKPYVTLRAGGSAERFVTARDRDELAMHALIAQAEGWPISVLGWGSNMLPSDDGVPGIVIRNLARTFQDDGTGSVWVETGFGYQDLFLKTVQLGYRGLEFAVGIPGSIGGALVSNAGAYRSNISEFVRELDVVWNGKREVVGADWMGFKYRDSVLRTGEVTNAVVLAIRMELPRGPRKAAYDEAREYQRQRISKQPPSPSAGSFFKNVTDLSLATTLDDLPGPLKEKGIIPAGFLIERAGLKGFRIGGAAVGKRHANFILNINGATATEIRLVAEHVKHAIRSKYGVLLEEEVLFAGDWSRFSVN
ncbi:MurB UDP-N-acetylmuramate dehydrogenase [Fimbriimonadaceae bacterium]